MPANAARRMDFAVTKDSLTRFAGLPFIARLARFLESLRMGGGHLSSVDTLSADTAACRVAGLRAVPGSRRLGEFLTRLSD